MDHLEIERLEQQFKRVKDWQYTFASTNEWNEFCRDVGIRELQSISFEGWRTLLKHNPGYKIFQDIAKHSQERIQKLHWQFNVVPYGAGSSFIGALQSWLLKGTVLNTAERTRNLWDDDFGPMMTFPIQAYPKQTVISEFRVDDTETEECIQDMFGHHKTFNEVNQRYYNLLSKGLSRNNSDFNGHDKVIVEVTVHDYYIMFELMANSYINLFVDMDKETFYRCYFLATLKHNKGNFNRWLEQHGPTEFDYTAFGLPALQCSWKLYSIVKKYLPKMYKLNYKKFIEEQDSANISLFINRTLKTQDPTPEQIRKIQGDLKIYNDKNNELLSEHQYERWVKEVSEYERA